MLTAWRVTRRFALELASRMSTAASTDWTTQKRKMQSPIASTVLVVRIQLRRRCLSR